MKLTASKLATLAAPKAGNRIYSDNSTRGLGLRVTAANSRAWILNYSAHGKQHRATLGAYPAMGLEQARAAATALRADGTDPMAEMITVARVAAIWIERHALIHKRPASIANDQVNLNKHILPRLGAIKLVALRRGDIEALMADMAAIPIQANRALALLTTLMRYAIAGGFISANPCAGLKRFPENPRFVKVERADLDRLYAVLESHPNRRAANAVKLLVWTGARRGEILGARWAEFDLERGLWTRPAARTKQKRLSTIPLNLPALDLLATMRAEANGSEHVFPGDKPDQPLRDIKKFWTAVRRGAGLAELHLHDLRHVFAIAAIEAGVPLDALAPLLGHASTSITRTYANWSGGALREASAKAAERLAVAAK